MRSIQKTRALLALSGAMLIVAGCASGGKSRSSKMGDSPTPSKYVSLAASSNPTTRDRGAEPTLDDLHRLAAWVFIDGREGEFVDRNGKPQVEWIIDVPVSSTPTFRVEAHLPLLGTPKYFVSAFHAVDPPYSAVLSYSIKANKGRFEVGKDYSLLSPGRDFVVRNLATGDVVAEIAPLPPGTYRFFAGVKNGATKKEGLAVTTFTVAETHQP